jgi:hypothetical protein
LPIVEEREVPGHPCAVVALAHDIDIVQQEGHDEQLLGQLSHLDPIQDLFVDDPVVLH